MATAASTPAKPIDPRDRQRAESRFFSAYAFSIAFLIVAGFVPSFYLRGVVPPYISLVPITTAAVAHGLVGTVFTLAFPLQAWLISSGRRELHIRLGKWVFLLGLALIPLTYLAVAAAYARRLQLPDGPPPHWSAFPLFALAAMAVLLFLAWMKRFNAQWHKRLIVILACLVARPALARMYETEPSIAGFWTFELVAFSLLAPLWIWDLAKHRRVHSATMLGTGVTLLFTLMRFFAGAPDSWWPRLLPMLPGF